MRVSFQFDRSFSICARSSPSSLPTSPRVLMAAAAPLRPSISVSRLSGRRLRLESGAVAPPESPLPLLPGPAAARSASRRASSSSRRRLSARRFCCTKERGERPDAVSNTRGARRKARGGGWARPHLVPLHLCSLLLLCPHGPKRLDMLQRLPDRLAVLKQSPPLIPHLQDLMDERGRVSTPSTSMRALGPARQYRASCADAPCTATTGCARTSCPAAPSSQCVLRSASTEAQEAARGWVLRGWRWRGAHRSAARRSARRPRCP